MRLDFNTEDIWRMEAALPTVKLLRSRASAVIVVSHRGRPKRRDPKLSLRRDGRSLERLLKARVRFIPHLRFAEIARDVARAERGSVYLLENLRFHPGEAKNDPAFAKQLASLADYYVNEAFAVSHRSAASVVRITRFLPSYAGLGLEQEIRYLTRAMQHPKHPLVLVVGGGKAHDKLGVLSFFRTKADAFLLGGASANTILKKSGIDVGDSKVDDEVEDASMLAKIAKFPNVRLPVDWVMERGAILDLGPKTIGRYTEILAKARTVIWSGPMGYIEKPQFEKGNLAVAQAIARNRKAFSVTGGGETVMFLKKHGLGKKFSFLSTGGGAMLDFLAGEKLPGIEALKKGKR